MLEVIKSKLTTKKKQNLENIYELLYEVEVNKNNLIVEQDKKISELKYKVMELEEKIENYKQKLKELRDENGK